MDEIKIKFSDAMMPGIIVALVSIVISLVLQFTIEDMQVRQNMGYVTWIVLIGLIIYFGIQYRTRFGDSGFPYGKAFVYLFYILLISSALSVVYMYVNFTIIDPASVEQAKELAAEPLYNNPDLTDEQIEQAISMQEKMMTPVWMTIWGSLGMLVFSAIGALVGAIFVKKNPVISLDEN
jgi:ABC-type tungstate transport system substrate-binding protein